MTKRNDSVFSAENAHIWKTVYGVPVGIAVLLLIFGSGTVQGFGLFLIASVIGSYLCISLAEWINS